MVKVFALCYDGEFIFVGTEKACFDYWDSLPEEEREEAPLYIIEVDV